ncbi:MAG: ATP-binding protein [Rhodospirillaceae bacterium]
MKRRSILPLFRKTGPSLQRLRLATVVLVMSFALLMIATAIYYLAEQYYTTVDAAARSARSAANAAQAHATRTFVETYRVLEGIGEIYQHSVEHGGIGEQSLHELLAKRLRQTPGVYVFTIFDASFNGVISGLSYPIATERYRDVPLRELRDAGQGRYFGPLYQNNSPENSYAGEWSLPLAHAIQAPNAPPVGYAVALINTRYFSRYFSTLDVGSLGHIAMWAEDGRLIAATPNFPVTAGATGATGGTGANGQSISVHTGIEGVPASISVTLDARDYMANWRQTRNQIAFAVATIILAMGSFTLIILRQLLHSQKNENALRQAKAAAEEANEAKSRFLAHMSHEFRTPLNAIMGFSEIIRNKVLGDSVSSAYTTYADHIHRSGEHLLNIVNDILDMAKIESGVQPLQQDTVHMRQVVSAAVSFVQGLATQRGLRISVETPSHLPAVSGDERFIRQVLINLLSNAIKFSPAEGEILVWTTYRAGHWLDISVKDSGPGIEPALLRRLGEPFLQGNPAVSHLGKGTGLGLSICKRYMDLLGGELKIESIVGIGTTATIRFPNKLLALPDDA